MKIVVANYKEGVPTRVQQVYDPKELDVELVDLKFLEPLSLDGEVLWEAEAITFQGKLTAKIRRICGRTLKEIDEDLFIPFKFYFSAGMGDVIDTTENIREIVLIEQPMVYYAPGSEAEALVDPKRDETEKMDEELKKEKNPFSKLEEMKDRLKEEGQNGSS